jgi:hypothetical protein
MESLANAIIFGLGQVALASPLSVEELAQIAQVFDEFAVAIGVGVELAELPGQSGLGVARGECAHLEVELVVEEKRATLGPILGRHIRIKPAPLLGFLAGHNRPTDGLGVFEDPGLDGFVFSGCGHDAAFYLYSSGWSGFR